MRFVNDLVALACVASLVSASPYDWSQHAGQLSEAEAQCHGQCGRSKAQLRANDACKDCVCDNEELISLIKSCYVCATPNIQNIYGFRMSEAPPKCKPASNTNNATSEDAGHDHSHGDTDNATSEDAAHDHNDHSRGVRDESQDMEKSEANQVMELQGTRDGKVQKEDEYEEEEDENKMEKDEEEAEAEAKDKNDEKEEANDKVDEKEKKNVSKEDKKEKEEGMEIKMDDKKNEISSTLPTTSAAAGFGQSALVAVGITAALVLGMM